MFHVEHHIMKKIRANIIDVVNREIFPGEVTIKLNRILKISRTDFAEEGKYILPGLIDSHIHIESSMLTPSEFSLAVMSHGTVGTVSDPHEIANVLGLRGINFMIGDASRVPLKIYFGAPSCVPATQFESSGARIGSDEIELLMERPEIKFLSEMMNFPGVLNEDPEVMKKIEIALKKRKPIDGHAPGLRGEKLKKYIEAGIQTDHECYSLEEALEKIGHGMKILIREGSAARNYDALYSLIDSHPDDVMFCLDDMHPDELLEGHINLLVKRSLERGLDFFNVLRAATFNPVKFYDLDVGLLQENDPADFIIIDDINNFNILETWIEGERVFGGEKPQRNTTKSKEALNIFFRNVVNEEDIQIEDKGKDIVIIEALDGELLTRKVVDKPISKNGFLISDPEKDILKIVVQNRYKKEKPATGFIRNFGISRGGMISTIAHDSHNIVCIGTGDRIILELLEWINVNKGGIAFSDGKQIYGLPLPVGGIMSDKDAKWVSEKYIELDQKVKESGSDLEAPFMTLSFMSLLVIPEIKLGNRGLFDVNMFDFISLYAD